jgi:DNA-binding NtrC family response regulator
MEVMLSYAWPGNVRELENAIERAVVIGKGDWVQSQDLLIGKSDELRRTSIKGRASRKPSPSSNGIS